MFGVPASLENKGESCTRPWWHLRLNASRIYCGGGRTGGCPVFFMGLRACLWGVDRVMHTSV